MNEEQLEEVRLRETKHFRNEIKEKLPKAFKAMSDDEFKSLMDDLFSTYDIWHRIKYKGKTAR